VCRHNAQKCFELCSRVGQLRSGSAVTPAIVAASHGHIEPLAYSKFVYSHCERAVSGNFALYSAASNNHYAAVEFLLQQGNNVNVNQQRRNGKSALFVAALRGHTSIVRLLLHHSANASLRDRYDRDALAYLSFHTRSHYDCAVLLIWHGASAPRSLEAETRKFSRIPSLILEILPQPIAEEMLEHVLALSVRSRELRKLHRN
jgi:hypothetical protein